MNEIRYRVLRCATELGQVPIEEVAKIAAMLVHNASSAVATKGLVKKDGDDEKPASGEATPRKRVDEENPLVEATAKAFELLEIAYYGNFGLKNDGSYEAGLAEFIHGKKNHEDFLKGIAVIRKWEHKPNESRWKAFRKFTERRDLLAKELEQGRDVAKRQEISAKINKVDGKLAKLDMSKNKRFEPVAFDEGLKTLIPKPGVPKANEAEARLLRLRSFLTDWMEIKPEQNAQDRSKEIDEHIAKMKREGIPPQDFDKWLVVYPEWWKQRKSETNSANAKGQPPKSDKKGKQGRVRSKNDKRLRARPPSL